MKKLNHFILAGIFAVSASALAKSHGDYQQQIVGGVEASIGEFPFIVSLQGSYGHFCGGSLIKKNWVLTAAHCVKGGTIRKIVIGLHDQKDSSKAESISPKRIIAHPSYNSRTMDYDYALVELTQDSTYAPIAINPTEIEIPQDGSLMSTVAGWGATKEGSYSLPSLLQKVDVPLVGSEACNKSYNNQLTDRMICAGLEEGGKDSCQGDSGGPLIAQSDDNQSYLVGVVSWGQGCARAKYFGVYSKVNAVADWINSTAR